MRFFVPTVEFRKRPQRERTYKTFGIGGGGDDTFSSSMRITSADSTPFSAAAILNNMLFITCAQIGNVRFDDCGESRENEHLHTFSSFVLSGACLHIPHGS